ncbi:hypothetical protein [Candidatus Protofrankia californiensis]|uniref:hypothetical protein n=1 Tax=Candidatus Protofrankia californiensis TaxID=1839754 RepID=UPI0019D11287|nr:hypothetical protein [Candidatus Protofrankia californiensis]
MICESIERVARRTYYGTRIEHELEQAGVALLAADEPMTLSRLRATTVLTRRVKQGVAEWLHPRDTGKVLGRLLRAHRTGLECRTSAIRLPTRHDPASCAGGTPKAVPSTG